ncbi:hypothetical protein V8C35DRAFT_289506 [Trichoderma chlorosporum]
MTLHRPRDYVEFSSRTAGSPCISGRTLIACQNCASAKTGCDKKIPCSRCTEKNLQCTARYARRASKAAIRAAQTAPSSTKSQIAQFRFGSQSFQESSNSFKVDKNSENITQDPSHYLRGGIDQHDDGLWDIFNPLSPLSGYSAVAPSLGGSSSYSDNLNAFKPKQDSPMPMFSEFSANMELITHDVSITIPKSHRCYPENLLNDSNDSHLFSEASYLPEIKAYDGLIQTPDAREDASGFLGGRHKSELDIGSVSHPPRLQEIPSPSDTRTWVKRLRQKGLFDSDAPDFATDEWMRSHQQPKAKRGCSNRDRLVYNWVKLDQELSLFYDVEHSISACDFERLLPNPELPWDTKNILQTSGSYLLGNLHVDIRTDKTLDFESRSTLNQLFKDFLHGTLSRRVPPRHFELLLHPLQALVYHSKSLLSWIKHGYSPLLSDAAESTKLEAQRLLQEWYNIAIEAYNEHLSIHDTTLALILYHFTYLNLISDFVDIERLADRENLSISFWKQSLQEERSICNRQDTIFHCGQALRYLRAINANTRPWWWPTAVHRAVLTLWAASTLGSGTNHGKAAVFSPKDSWPRDCMDVEAGIGMAATPPKLSIVAIDSIAPEDPILSDANWSERHMLVLTREDKGVVILSDAMGILQYGVSLINAFPSSVDGEAVVTKLKELGQAWARNNSNQMYYQD